MGSLDEYKPVQSPNTDEGASPESAIENMREYGLLLQEYVKHRRELHEYKRRNEQKMNDPEVISFSGIMNGELHAWHNRLNETGAKIGKGEYDIIVDIYRQEGNLSRFGLPEFCLLTTDDVFLGNAGGERFVPRGGEVPHRRSGDIP